MNVIWCVLEQLHVDMKVILVCFETIRRGDKCNTCVERKMVDGHEGIRCVLFWNNCMWT
jgi:hypothetical protein